MKLADQVACITLCYGDLVTMITMTWVPISHAVLPGKYRDWLR